MEPIQLQNACVLIRSEVRFIVLKYKIYSVLQLGKKKQEGFSSVPNKKWAGIFPKERGTSARTLCSLDSYEATGILSWGFSHIIAVECLPNQPLDHGPQHFPSRLNFSHNRIQFAPIIEPCLLIWPQSYQQCITWASIRMISGPSASHVTKSS